VTTGIKPFAVGSVEQFQLRVDLNGLPHSLAGGSATISFQDPNNNVTGPFAASIVGDDAFYTYTIVSPLGTWTRSWTWIDSAGVKQVSLPIQFVVLSSP
jgi:hypothetical protein